MGRETRFVFTVPKQIPLFEEQEDGILKEYKKED
jgi:hypothetical protein